MKTSAKVWELLLGYHPPVPVLMWRALPTPSLNPRSIWWEGVCDRWPQRTCKSLNVWMHYHFQIFNKDNKHDPHLVMLPSQKKGAGGLLPFFSVTTDSKWLLYTGSVRSETIVVMVVVCFCLATSPISGTLLFTKSMGLLRPSLSLILGFYSGYHLCWFLLVPVAPCCSAGPWRIVLIRAASDWMPGGRPVACRNSSDLEQILLKIHPHLSPQCFPMCLMCP